MMSHRNARLRMICAWVGLAVCGEQVQGGDLDKGARTSPVGAVTGHASVFEFDLWQPAAPHPWDGTSGIKLVDHDPDGGQALVRVEFGDHVRVRIRVLHGPDAKGWTVNVGDSHSNNGHGGDGADQSNDAELQIVDGMLTVFGSDYAPPNEKVLQKGMPAAEPGRWTEIEIADGELRWTDTSTNKTRVFNSPFVFALGGQQDKEGTPNRTIFVAINRTISLTPDRLGTGAKRLAIEFVK